MFVIGHVRSIIRQKTNDFFSIWRPSYSHIGLSPDVFFKSLEIDYNSDSSPRCARKLFVRLIARTVRPIYCINYAIEFVLLLISFCNLIGKFGNYLVASGLQPILERGPVPETRLIFHSFGLSPVERSALSRSARAADVKPFALKVASQWQTTFFFMRYNQHNSLCKCLIK